MKLEAPQIIMLLLYFVTILNAANKHGQRSKEVHNLGVTLLACAIGLGLLYWGGFFG
jgi:hypothetical protein